ncbi:MAG TPA: hypothetical protein VKZ18_24925 [Polyangia bacterium]|nr:hypothetical protein [Polyangia bacterium]
MEASSRTDADAAPAPSLGALVHGVVNSTASIAFSVGALRAGGTLAGNDLEALARIEQAAAMVADTVKRFASAAPARPSAARAGAIVDLYEVCCEVADERRRERGSTIYCRAFGDSRGPWRHAQVFELTKLMVDSALVYLGADAHLTLSTTGFERHVRLSVQGIGWLSSEARKACQQIPSGVAPSLNGLMTVTTSGPGTVLSIHLPR